MYRLKNVSYKDPRGNSYGEYRGNKQSKLIQQNAEGLVDQLFYGLIIMLNGRLEPDAQYLRKLIGMHGGTVIFQYQTGTTHMVAQNLSASKITNYGNKRIPIVTPQWILQSVERNVVLPTDLFMLQDIATIRNIQQQDTSQVAHFNFSQFFENASIQVEKQESKIEFFLNLMDKHTIDMTVVGMFDKQRSFPQIEVSTPVQVATQSPNIALSPITLNLVQPAQPQANFVESYHSHSRLHHLSQWKLDAQEFLLENPPYGPQPQVHSPPLFMHIDLDYFFCQASLSILDKQKFAGLPVVVSSSAELKDDSTADIASCNYVAREFGISNGMWVRQAKEKCPNLIVLEYDFPLYQDLSHKFYECLRQISSEVMPISCDEAYIKLNGIVDSPLNFGQQLKAEILMATCLQCTIGYGNNLLQARIATKLGKPNGLCVLEQDSFLREIGSKPIDIIPGIGYETKAKFQEKFSANTCQDVANLQLQQLEEEFGPIKGKQIYQAIRGIDFQFVFRSVQNVKQPKTLGIYVNYGVRTRNYFQLSELVQQTAIELLKRATTRKLNIKKLKLTLNIRAQNAAVKPTKFNGMGYCDPKWSSQIMKSTDSIDSVAQSLLKEMQNYKFEDVRGLELVGLVGDPINVNIEEQMIHVQSEIQICDDFEFDVAAIQQSSLMQKASQSAFDLSKIFEAEDDDEIKVAKIGQLAGTILDFDVREEFKFTFILYFVRRGNLSMVIKLQRIIYRDISALLKEQWPTIDF